MRVLETALFLLYIERPKRASSPKSVQDWCRAKWTTGACAGHELSGAGPLCTATGAMGCTSWAVHTSDYCFLVLGKLEFLSLNLFFIKNINIFEQKHFYNYFNNNKYNILY
jgi:hypothetical protein